MKKVLALLLAVCLASAGMTTLVGCGPNPGPQESPPTTPDPFNDADPAKVKDKP